MASDIVGMIAVDVPLPSPPKGVALAGFLPIRFWDGTGGDLSASLLKIDREDGSKLVIVAVDTFFLDDEFQALLQQRLRKISALFWSHLTHILRWLLPNPYSLLAALMKNITRLFLHALRRRS